MNIRDRLVGACSRETVDLFHQARLVRIAQRTFAIWLDPFWMLDPEVIMELLPELAIGVDLVRHCNWPGERSKDGARRRIVHKFCQYDLHPGHEQFITASDFLCAVSARRGQVRVFQKAARTCLRFARRQANWPTL